VGLTLWNNSLLPNVQCVGLLFYLAYKCSCTVCAWLVLNLVVSVLELELFGELFHSFSLIYLRSVILLEDIIEVKHGKSKTSPDN
jgi:hypothetical protein